MKTGASPSYSGHSDRRLVTPGNGPSGLTVMILALCLAGCGDPNAVRVHLYAHTPPGKDLLRLEIQAQVAGPQNGLRYKWFSVSGGCEPQESDWPTTVFKFAENTTRDRVSVEVWRDEKQVARSEIDVTLDEERLRLETERVIGVKVEITSIPPYDPYGGHDTRADIAGKIDGKVASDYKVVLYARVADTWYIQPLAGTSHSIFSDNTWSNWTHTGSSYAALLVRPGYDPSSRLDLLPPVGGYVVARTVVEGTRTQPKETNR